MRPIRTVATPIIEFGALSMSRHNCSRRRYPLALIDRKHVRRRGTFTQEQEKGRATSPFALFAEEAFALFCPLQRAGPGQIR